MNAQKLRVAVACIEYVTGARGWWYLAGHIPSMRSRGGTLLRTVFIVDSRVRISPPRLRRGFTQSPSENSTLGVRVHAALAVRSKRGVHKAGRQNERSDKRPMLRRNVSEDNAQKRGESPPGNVWAGMLMLTDVCTKDASSHDPWGSFSSLEAQPWASGPSPYRHEQEIREPYP